MKTDRPTRFKGFWSGVLHWVYFPPLRKHGDAWTDFIIWGSFAGGLMCLTGLGIGVWRFSLSGRFRQKHQRSHSPYDGLMRWHHYSGLLFGLVTFTWIISGAFSVNPFGMFSDGRSVLWEQQTVLSGGPENFDSITLDSLRAGVASIEEHFPAKEVDVLQFRGELYLTADRPPAQGDSPDGTGPVEHRMVSLSAPEKGAFTRFDRAVMEDIADELMPGVALRDRVWIHDYDHYYRSRDNALPLPVLRLRYLDPRETWLYLDPYSGTLREEHRASRTRRWFYNALHEFDIPILYASRPLWDIAVILFSLGGIVLSGSTLWPMARRLFRHARRLGKRFTR